jgi:hypothetical protein
MDKFEQKMKADGNNDAAIAAFRHNYEQLTSGSTGMVPEDTIEAVSVRCSCSIELISELVWQEACYRIGRHGCAFRVLVLPAPAAISSYGQCIEHV